jgi:hypothetical protein
MIHKRFSFLFSFLKEKSQTNSQLLFDSIALKISDIRMFPADCRLSLINFFCRLTFLPCNFQFPCKECDQAQVRKQSSRKRMGGREKGEKGKMGKRGKGEKGEKRKKRKGKREKGKKGKWKVEMVKRKEEIFFFKFKTTLFYLIITGSLPPIWNHFELHRDPF